jgi:HAD superfamily hydrolase (TIGR01509 family)
MIMLTLNNQEVAAAIFDVDSTLLDNSDFPDPRLALHERSRLAAVHEIGRRHDIKELQELDLDANLDAFLSAKTHTLNGAVWNILYRAGLVVEEELELSNPLLQEIVNLKNELHKDVLLEYGKEMPGARNFLLDLCNAGLRGKMAVASTAVRRDIDVFFTKFDMWEFFAQERVITLENVTHAKPHPEAFDLAYRTLGLPDELRSRTLAFEDDPRGIMSAKAAGLIVCGITSRYSRADLAALEVAPDIIADSYAEFSQILGLGSTSPQPQQV